MKAVFADTLYWLAITNPGDSWGGSAKAARAKLGNIQLVTTDEVLTEFMAGLAGGGEHLRRLAVKMVRAILDNPNVRVIPQSRQSFLRGVELYEDRPDKQYSLTDCISMATMKAESLTEVLTHDHHFTQEGRTILIKKE